MVAVKSGLVRRLSLHSLAHIWRRDGAGAFWVHTMMVDDTLGCGVGLRILLRWEQFAIGLQGVFGIIPCLMFLLVSQTIIPQRRAPLMVTLLLAMIQVHVVDGHVTRARI